jgi:hypothetical protein
MEEWKTITDYPSYEVSNLGQVRNKTTGAMKKATVRPDNCCVVGLWDNGVSEVCYIHRLVCEEFLGWSDKRTVNHKDGNRQNNRLDNLEWATDSENIQHSYDNLPRTKAVHPHAVAIRQLNLDGTLYATYKSVREATISTGFPMSSIRQALTPSDNKRTHPGLKKGQRIAKGYIWEKV